MEGRFVISTAGHDAGKIYMVVGTDNGVLLLADGVERTTANPKRKNRRHVEFLHQELSNEATKHFSMKITGNDEEIRQTIHHLIKDNLKYKIRK